MPFMQMVIFLSCINSSIICNNYHDKENVEAYITACRKIGIPDEYNFLTIDLFEGKNIGQVSHTNI